MNQLRELDKQISDLRLDVEKTSEERLETDNRFSSGECGGTRPMLKFSSQPPVLCILRPAKDNGVCFWFRESTAKQNRKVCYSVAMTGETKSGNKFIKYS